MPNASLLALGAVAVAVAVVGLVTGDGGTDPEVALPPAPTFEARPRVVVHERVGLDDVLLLGAPFGVEDRGALVTIDLATGAVEQRMHGGELWPPGIKEPTTDPAHPDALAAARSPDGKHIAVFTRSTADRLTGVLLDDRFHHLQSVGEVVGGRLVWSPGSDAVYLIAAGVAGGSADRVIGIPLIGSPQTVVRLDERGYQWLAVERAQ